MPLRLTTYYHGHDIPALPGNNMFHSKELFLVYEATPGYTPLMIVGSLKGTPVFKLLAVIRKNTRTFPSAWVKRCEIYGTGELLDEKLDKETLFGEVLTHLTGRVIPDSFLVEFRNLESTLFGYRFFRENNYFPVNWLRVRNSLHSLKSPMQRFSESRRRQIKNGLKNGAVISEAITKEEVTAFWHMLKKNYSAKIRKHFPEEVFFQELITLSGVSHIGKIFIVKFKEKIIGGSVCVYSQNNAYLWFSGGLKKSYPKQYPGVLAVWEVLEDAYGRNIEHLEFMDVGLPFKHHGYRDFVLRFGGKQSSTRRWYLFRWNFLNKIFTKIYV